MYVVERFARYAHEFRSGPIPAQALHHAKRAVIDWHAAVVPGALVAPATLLERARAEDLDRGSAALILGRPATARAAALINGTAAHAVEVDDIFKFGIYHPGAPTIAAAFAAAQAVRANGEALVRAVIVGYEISTRIGAAMGRAHYRFWHNTGTVGTFGAAAACAEVYRLDAARFAHAIATASTFAAGLQQAFRIDSMSKPLHSGHAAEAGLLAAQAAREGVTGSLDVIEGDGGRGALQPQVRDRHRPRPRQRPARGVRARAPGRPRHARAAAADRSRGRTAARRGISGSARRAGGDRHP